MNDKKIIPQIERNYIETLYLYCNIEDFAQLKEHHPSFAYFNMMSYINDVMLPKAKCLGDADGRTWYQFKNYRMGLMGYDKAKVANQFNCKIQYEQHHMWTLDKSLNGLDLPFSGSRSYYHIQRIDITKIAKLDMDYTSNHGYISPYNGMRKEYGTVYLGHRRNGNVFRIYNKTKELLDTENYKKIEMLSQYFGDIENLYTFELELKRKHLKGSLGIETLSDLDKVYAASQNIISKIRFYRDNDHNKRLLKNDNRDRISCKVLSEFVEYERLPKKKYKPSFPYAVDSIVKTMDRYIESMELPKSNDEYMKFINEIISRRVNSNSGDMVITYEDTQENMSHNGMLRKWEAMRDGQSNDLEVEARRIFTYKPREATVGGEVSRGAT